MTAYAALFRIRLINSIQYRTAALAGIATQFAWGFMLILAFRAFYESNPGAFPMTLQQTVSYIWMQQAFLALFMLWFFDNSIFASIESGEIAYDLVRPMDLYSRWFTTTTANRIAGAALRCLPILIVGFILPHPFRLVLPGSFLQMAAFFFSLLLSLGVVISFAMLIYVSAFFTINSQGTRLMAAVAGDFLAGGTIPIPFFPDNVRRVLELLPFGSMQNMPLLIFSGAVTGADMALGLLLQVFWIVVLVAAGRLWIARAIKRVVAQGG
ncbi:MAG: ABC transporter permease [Defluviitaleaceae bacterium]|nr:ABC transporter permease [Defluviitaleaceae bacterium]